MFQVIAGTNRPGARSLLVARLVAGFLEEAGARAAVLDLGDLPPSLFDPSSYDRRPADFEPFQDAVLEAEGLVVVVPEYNGSYPGVLKYFLDMLRFPESLKGIPAAFVGISAGRWGALRAVEQLEMVFQYRSAHLFGRRVFLPGIGDILQEDGTLADPEIEARLRRFAGEFVAFSQVVNGIRF